MFYLFISRKETQNKSRASLARLTAQDKQSTDKERVVEWKVSHSRVSANEKQSFYSLIAH